MYRSHGGGRPSTQMLKFCTDVAAMVRTSFYGMTFQVFMDGGESGVCGAISVEIITSRSVLVDQSCSGVLLFVALTFLRSETRSWLDIPTSFLLPFPDLSSFAAARQSNAKTSPIQHQAFELSVHLFWRFFLGYFLYKLRPDNCTIPRVLATFL